MIKKLLFAVIILVVICPDIKWHKQKMKKQLLTLLKNCGRQWSMETKQALENLAMDKLSYGHIERT